MWIFTAVIANHWISTNNNHPSKLKLKLVVHFMMFSTCSGTQKTCSLSQHALGELTHKDTLTLTVMTLVKMSVHLKTRRKLEHPQKTCTDKISL